MSALPGHHRIGQLRLDIRFECASPDRLGHGQALQQRLTACCPSALEHGLQAALDAAAPGEDWLHLRQLTLDLGSLPAASLERELPLRLANALRSQLQRLGLPAPSRPSAPHTPPGWQALCDWISQGKSHASPAQLADWLTTALDNHARALRPLLLSQRDPARLASQLAHSLPEATLARLTALLEPSDAAYIVSYARQLQQRQAALAISSDRQGFQASVWTVILHDLLASHGSEFNRRSFVAATLRRLAQRYRLDYAVLLAQLTAHLEQQLQRAGQRSGLLTLLYALGRSLHATPAAETADTALGQQRWQALRQWLAHGALARQTRLQPAALVNAALTHTPASLRQLLYASAAQPVSVRLAQLPEALLGQLVQLLQPSHADAIVGYARQLRQRQQQQALVRSDAAGFHTTLWSVILHDLLVSHGSEFNRRSFIAATLRRIARHYQVDYAELLQQLSATLQDWQTRAGQHGSLLDTLEHLALADGVTRQSPAQHDSAALCAHLRGHADRHTPALAGLLTQLAHSQPAHLAALLRAELAHPAARRRLLRSLNPAQRQPLWRWLGLSLSHQRQHQQLASWLGASAWAAPLQADWLADACLAVWCTAPDTHSASDWLAQLWPALAAISGQPPRLWLTAAYVQARQARPAGPLWESVQQHWYAALTGDASAWPRQLAAMRQHWPSPASAPDAAPDHHTASRAPTLASSHPASLLQTLAHALATPDGTARLDPHWLRQRLPSLRPELARLPAEAHAPLWARLAPGVDWQQLTRQLALPPAQLSPWVAHAWLHGWSRPRLAQALALHLLRDYADVLAALNGEAAPTRPLPPPLASSPPSAAEERAAVCRWLEHGQWLGVGPRSPDPARRLLRQLHHADGTAWRAQLRPLLGRPDVQQRLLVSLSPTQLLRLWQQGQPGLASVLADWWPTAQALAQHPRLSPPARRRCLALHGQMALAQLSQTGPLSVEGWLEQVSASLAASLGLTQAAYCQAMADIAHQQGGAATAPFRAWLAGHTTARPDTNTDAPAPTPAPHAPRPRPAYRPPPDTPTLVKPSAPVALAALQRLLSHGQPLDRQQLGQLYAVSHTLAQRSSGWRRHWRRVLQPGLTHAPLRQRLIQQLPPALRLRLLWLWLPDPQAAALACLLDALAHSLPAGQRQRGMALAWDHLLTQLADPGRRARLAQHWLASFSPLLSRHTGLSALHWQPTLLARLGAQAGSAARVARGQVQALWQLAVAHSLPAEPAAHPVSRPAAESTAGRDAETDTASSGPAIAIGNAGLVVLWPFLGHYFERLGLVADGAFVDATARSQAVFLLQFLASGHADGEESALWLNKLLCGMPASESPVWSAAPDEHATQLGLGLLHMVTQRWDKLKHTSVAGLRESFLLRDGLLRDHDDRLTLSVSPRAYDMLLDSLPWRLAMIKLPWMPRVLWVHWR